MKSLLVKTYVNCVKFFSSKHLLASAGNILEVFDIGTSQLITSSTIFKNQRIHGIVVKNDQVLIHGGFNLALVDISVHGDHVTIDIICQWTTGHWVQDASFFDDNKYAVLGSSNVLYLYKQDTYKKVILDKEAHCKEKSVLYSGKILGTTWLNAVVLCGTVFSQVTIWSPLLNHCNVVQRLIGHTGVIFSVTYHETKQTICSTSDDRSLRLWQVEMDNSTNILQDWCHAKITLRYSIFGHTARVWKNLQLNCGKILSIGEDGQLKVWLKDICVQYWNTHQNGNVWSLDYDESSQLIATGGGDGGICIWPLSDNKKLTEPNQIDLNLTANDFPRQVVIANNEKLLIYTNSGTILSHVPGNNKMVLKDNRFKSYCILTISKTKRLYSAASITGDILIFKEDTDELLCQYQACIAKIFSFHWLSNSKFIICKPQGELNLLQLESEGKAMHETHKLLLPPCKERWLTSAVLTSEILLVCGDRDGSIHIYNLGTEDLVKTYQKIHSRLGVSCIEHIDDKTLLSIGRDGFLRHWEIVEEENNKDNVETLNHVSADKLPLEWPAHIVPTGADTYIIGFNEIHLVIWSTREQKVIFRLKCGGGHRSWDYSLQGSQFYFSFIKQKQVYHLNIDLSELTRPAIVQSYHRDEINTLRFVQIGEEQLLLSGGEDNTLRLSCVTRHTLDTRLILRSHISAIRCVDYVNIGGTVYIVSAGGRAQLKLWKLSLSRNSQYQCKELYSHMLNGKDHKEKSWRLVQPRIHPETRYMDVTLHQDGSRIYIATACSDGFVRIFLYQVENNALLCLREMNHHRQCVLKVHFVQHGSHNLLFSMSTRGDVALWSFCDLTTSEGAGDVITNSVNDFGHGEITKEISAKNLSTQQNLQEEQNVEIISLHLKMDDQSSSETTTRTKEHIASSTLTHSTNNTADPVAVYQLHQGGINSFDSFTAGSELLLISGGDDCSIVLTKVSADLEVRLQIRKQRAHNSQITGAKFLNERRFVSASVDQQIILWTWRQEELVKLSQHDSCIPDVHGLDVTGDNLVAVYGCGVNIVQVDEAEHASS